MKPIVVNVQANTRKEFWEDVPSVQHTFNSEVEVAKFAYRLAIQLDCEVRVSGKGNNGRYFSPTNADEYLSNN